MATRSNKLKPKPKLTNSQVVAITIAVITGFCTVIAACVGLGVPLVSYYINSKSAQPTPYLLPNAKSISSIINVRSSQVGCSGEAAIVLPSTIIPEKSSYKTISQIPDFFDLPISPIPSGDYSVGRAYNGFPLGTVLPWQVTIGNSPAPNENWIRISNNINIKLDLATSNVDKHINLLLVYGGCGIGDQKEFSPAFLNTSTLNQFISAEEYDFFKLSPGEFEEFEIDFVCETPGTYQATIMMTMSSSNSSEEFISTSTDIFVCPSSYSLWATEVQSSSPLDFVGEYYWDGTEYKD